MDGALSVESRCVCTVLLLLLRQKGLNLIYFCHLNSNGEFAHIVCELLYILEMLVEERSHISKSDQNVTAKLCHSKTLT